MVLRISKNALSVMVIFALGACSKSSEEGSNAATPPLVQAKEESPAVASNPVSASAEMVVKEPLHPAGPYVERPIHVGVQGWELPGTFILPKGTGPFPAVILVHGSGPNDRNGKVGANMPLKDIAEGLAARGIASLRYDKRTMVHGQRMMDLSPTLDDEVFADALSALQVLSEQEGVDKKRLFVIGHSLGAQLGPEVVKRSELAVGGVLLAAPTRKPWELIVEQLAYLEQPEELRKMATEAADKLASGKVEPSESLLGVPASYWMEWGSYDPIAAVKESSKPFLVVQGGRDYQVTSTDYALWQQAFPNDPRVTLKQFPKLNHLMIEGEGKPTPQEYFNPGKVSSEVIAAIAYFVLASP